MLVIPAPAGIHGRVLKEESRKHVVEGFTGRYCVTQLMWYELHPMMESAIQREKRIKKWNRRWKLRLIDAMNPSWRDLWPDSVDLTPKAVSMDPRLRGDDDQKR